MCSLDLGNDHYSANRTVPYPPKKSQGKNYSLLKQCVSSKKNLIHKLGQPFFKTFVSGCYLDWTGNSAAHRQKHLQSKQPPVITTNTAPLISHLCVLVCRHDFLCWVVDLGTENLLQSASKWTRGGETRRKSRYVV